MLHSATILLLSFTIIAHGIPERVVGGRDAPNHKYPYQVSLRHLDDRHFCSGSILNEGWILTAAHCLDGISADNYTISAGTNYLNESGFRSSVMFHIVHENYENFLHHDVALIRVAGKITINDIVKAVSLAETNFSNYTISTKVAGWGSTAYGRPMSNALQEIKLKFIDMEKCRIRHREVTSSHLCTFNKIGQGLCHGDSGGPLVVEGVQVGVVSYIIPCAVGTPEVYTRVWSYRNWINDVMDRIDQNMK